MRGRNRFKATDMKRAIITAKKAGLEVGRVEIGPDGTTSKNGEAPSPNTWHADEKRRGQ
jgi:hypothetical protein